MQAIDKNSTVKNLCSALLLITKTWSANSDNVENAQQIQQLYVHDIKCVMPYVYGANNNQKLQAILTQALHLGEWIAPDDNDRIQACLGYAEQLIQITGGTTGTRPIDADIDPNNEDY